MLDQALLSLGKKHSRGEKHGGWQDVAAPSTGKNHKGQPVMADPTAGAEEVAGSSLCRLSPVASLRIRPPFLPYCAVAPPVRASGPIGPYALGQGA